MIGPAVVLQAGGGPSTFEWAIIGILLTLLIAVGSAMGALIKIAYDATQRIGVTLHGDPENGDENGGFIQETRERNSQLEEQHNQVYEQLLIQGQLLSELAYSFAEIADELEQEEDVDVSVNLDRIEKLRERKEEDRWESSDD